jgi:hypothetical protein
MLADWRSQIRGVCLDLRAGARACVAIGLR